MSPGFVDELVDANEVALLLSLSHRNSVATYLRKYEDFPRPLLDRGPRRARYWARQDVLDWSAAHPPRRRPHDESKR